MDDRQDDGTRPARYSFSRSRTICSAATTFTNTCSASFVGSLVKSASRVSKIVRSARVRAARRFAISLVSVATLIYVGFRAHHERTN